MEQVKTHHLEYINSWLKAYGCAIMIPSLLTPNSFVLEDKGAIFLTRTDNMYMIIDGLVLNPDLKEGRKETVQELVAHAEKVAKDLGYSFLMGLTKLEAIENHALGIGFKKQLLSLIHI